MKKIIALLILISAVSLCLFACGNPEEESESHFSSETEWNDPDWTPPIK